MWAKCGRDKRRSGIDEPFEGESKVVVLGVSSSGDGADEWIGLDCVVSSVLLAAKSTACWNMSMP